MFRRFYETTLWNETPGVHKTTPKTNPWQFYKTSSEIKPQEVLQNYPLKTKGIREFVRPPLN